MTEVDITPADAPHEYTRFDSQADFQAAIDRLLGLDGRELRIFDPDLSALQFNSPERVERLRSFLAGSRTRRIYIAVHDTGHVTRFCPRLMSLLALYNHAIQINRTGEEIRELQDSFVVLDKNHYVRRPVARFFRGAAGINDETEALVMRSRFQEIWNASVPAVSSTATGL
jgi:hypothetical protein